MVITKDAKLHKGIELVADKTGLPYWIAKIEIADEAEVGSAYELTDEETDRMIALIEKYFGKIGEF